MAGDTTEGEKKIYNYINSTVNSSYSAINSAYVQTNAKTGGKNNNSVMAMPLNKTGGIANQTSKVYRIKKPT